MPLESVTYISDLVPANPDHNDALGVVDSHVRNIKAALKASFPSFAGAAVTLSEATLNGLATAAARLTALEGQANKLTGDQTITGNVSLSTGKTFNADAIAQGGNILVPHGVITLWFGPAGSVPAGWALCDGTQGTPDLRDRFVVGAGNTYAPGATGGNAVVSGSTANGGGHSHNGLTEGAGGHSHSASTDVQGTHSHTGSVLGHALTIDEIPPHNHSVSIHTGPGQSPSSSGDWATGAGYQSLTTNFVGSGWTHTHGISPDGGHAHGVSVDTAADHQHGIDWDAGHTHTLSLDVRPPYFGLLYIMKL